MPLFLFHGEDLYTQANKLRHWKTEFEKKHGDYNITVIERGSLTCAAILDCAAAVPFLSEKRLIIVRDFLADAPDEEQKLFAGSLETIPDFSVVVLSETTTIDKRTTLYKKVLKTATVQEFTAPTGPQMIAWIIKAVQAAGAQIEKPAALHLMELVPADLERLSHEIEKLTSYCNGRAITTADVELLVESTVPASIFRLTDAVGQKDRKVALSTLHDLLDSGEEIPKILYMIMRQFRIITCVKDLSDRRKGRDEMTRELKEHPFVISNTVGQAKNFSLAQLQKAYELLVELDKKMKTGGIKLVAGDSREGVLALDRLVIDLCR